MKFSRMDTFALGAVLGGAAMLGVASWFVDDLRSRMHTRMERGTIGLPTETVNVPVQVYAPEVKKELGLPKPVVADAKKRVVASAAVPPSEQSTHVTAVLDTGTGGVELFQYSEPRPFFGRDGLATVGASYGLFDGTPSWTAFGTYNFLRIGSVRLGATTAITQGSHWYAGFQVSYSW